MAKKSPHVRNPNLPGADVTPPATPLDLAVDGTTANSVSLSWTPNTDDTAVYTIRRGTTSGLSTSGVDLPPLTGISQSSYLDSGLSANTTYFYNIRATDSAGNTSPSSATVSATTDAVNQPPVYTGPIGTIYLQPNTFYVLYMDDIWNDPESDPITYSVLSGSLPTGLQFLQNPARIEGTPTVAGQTASVQINAVDSPPVQPPVQITTITVVGGSASTAWTAGVAFRQGDVPSNRFISCVGPSVFQAEVRNQWPDGSAKFAVISGIGGTTVQVMSSGTANSGTDVAPITAADVGTTSITINGTVVSLSSAISGLDLTNFTGTAGTAPTGAGKIRDGFVGPAMREAQYFSNVTGNAQLAVVWNVRKYANGTVEVETVVENGWFGITGMTAQTYTASVTVNGTVRAWHDGPSSRSITQGQYTRWSRADVVSGTLVPALPNNSYLMQTYLVPNYGWPTATSEEAFTSTNGGRAVSSITAEEASAPVPMTNGFWLPTQADVGEGFNEQIGILPHWDALYCRTGDIRAYYTSLSSGRTCNFLPTWRRDERTLKLPRTDATTFISYSAANAEREHQPSTGYLPYLLTGRWSYLEACQNTALWNFFKTPTRAPWPAVGWSGAGGRDGLKGLIPSGEIAPRAVAWPWRSLATALCISPNGSGTQADLLYVFQQNIGYFWGLQTSGSAMANSLGIVWSMGTSQFSTKDPGVTAENLIRTGMWQHCFLSSAIGFSVGLGLVTGTDDDNLRALHAFSVKPHVERLGYAYNGTGYSWRRCGTYYEPTGNSSTTAYGSGRIPASWFTSWRAVYDKCITYFGANDADDSSPSTQLPFEEVAGDGGFAPTEIEATGNTLDAISQHYITRNEIAALAFGTDYGVPGAAAAYNFLTQSKIYTNATGSQGVTTAQRMADFPRYVITPR